MLRVGNLIENRQLQLGRPVFEPLDPPPNPNVTLATVLQSDPQLIHVEYPALVLNPDKVIRTLGGNEKISRTFTNPRRKLEVKFRPGDPYSRSVKGEGSTTCGLLIKVRRRKVRTDPPQPPPSRPLIDLLEMDYPFEPVLSESGRLSPEDRREGLIRSQAHPVTRTDEDGGEDGLALVAQLGDGTFLSHDLLVDLDERKLKELDKIMMESLIEKPMTRLGLDRERTYIQVPPGFSRNPPPRSRVHVEPLGLVHFQYQFKGISDHQYLPFERKGDGSYESILEEALPVFGDPDAVDPKDLFASNFVDGGGDGDEVPSFLVPPVLSRIDKPIVSTVSFFEERRELFEKNRVFIRSTRPRRVIYSHMCNFRVTDHLVHEPGKVLVPKAAVAEALAEADKRGLVPGLLADMVELFRTRPIWTKQSLEFRCRMDKLCLKYLLPCVAYFSLNGPWRSCWIRLGFDPRKHKAAFLYQLIDYRVPFSYRSLLGKDKNERIEPESNFSFRPHIIPPKMQMFYQFCEVGIPEVAQLTEVMQRRVETNSGIEFDPKHGFLEEDIGEYLRYCISRYIEIELHRTGKIESVTLREIELLPGGQIPKHEVKGGGGGATRNPYLPFRARAKRTRNLVYQDPVQPLHSLDGEESNMADLSIPPEEGADGQGPDQEYEEDEPVFQQILGLDNEVDY